MLKSAKSSGLRGNVGYVGAWVTWVNFLRGLRGSNIFLRESIFLTWVQNFFRETLRGSRIFAWVKCFCRGQLLFTR